MEAKKLVGWNLRRLRVAKSLTIEELAGRAGIDSSFVGRLECGTVNASIVLIERIGRELGVKLVEFFVEPAPGAKAPWPLRTGRRPVAKRGVTRPLKE
jgi:transcriptional regulator with XRE-family HTH domain